MIKPKKDTVLTRFPTLVQYLFRSSAANTDRQINKVSSAQPIYTPINVWLYE